MVPIHIMSSMLTCVSSLPVLLKWKYAAMKSIQMVCVFVMMAMYLNTLTEVDSVAKLTNVLALSKACVVMIHT